MIIQKLIILGILKKGPKHGYQIKKIIQNELGLFSEPETQSIYYPLKQMEKGGLIKKEVVKAKGRLPHYTYTITPHGSKEFTRLAMQALLSRKRPFIDIDIPLYFLPYLDKKEVVARLRLRKRFLEKVKEWLEAKLCTRKEFSFQQLLLLKHNLNLLTAEEKFLEEMTQAIRT
ncbi:MAG: PadR family transcriptional regulator [Candidatus Omnitrophota bacterium]